VMYRRRRRDLDQREEEWQVVESSIQYRMTDDMRCLVMMAVSWIELVPKWPRPKQTSWQTFPAKSRPNLRSTSSSMNYY
jgi:hypothetical protein